MQAQPPTPFPDSLSGLIERVTFHNEDTGFAVLKVKAKGHRDLVTVVGSLARSSRVEILGEAELDLDRWLKHERHRRVHCGSLVG